LVSASGDFSPQNETSIRNLVEKFIARLSTANGTDGGQRQVPFAARRLEQTIQVGSQRNISSTMGLTSGAVDLEATNARKVVKNVEYEASRLLDQPDSTQSYEEFFMAVNPLQLGADAQSKSKDVKVDGIDVSIGGKRILTDTSLTLAFGRRYGLVGQNGIGKSTLLRALSRREVSIPTHISILHVEQEVF
jgi:ATP-binding cassette subfamily F protein 3